MSTCFSKYRTGHNSCYLHIAPPPCPVDHCVIQNALIGDIRCRKTDAVERHRPPSFAGRDGRVVSLSPVVIWCRRSRGSLRFSCAGSSTRHANKSMCQGRFVGLNCMEEASHLDWFQVFWSWSLSKAIFAVYLIPKFQHKEVLKTFKHVAMHGAMHAQLHVAQRGLVSSHPSRTPMIR